MFALHQSHFHTLAHDLLKQLLEQLRFLKPSVPGSVTVVSALSGIEETSTEYCDNCGAELYSGYAQNLAYSRSHTDGCFLGL